MSDEKIKLAIGVPTSGSNPSMFTYSYGTLMAYLAGGIRSRPNSDLSLTTEFQISSCILTNRELIVANAIKNEMTHLLFLDHDMRFEPQAIDILFSRRHPVVACNYLIKRQDHEPPEFTAVAPNGRRVITQSHSVGLQEITYTGFGVSLFEVRAFKKTKQPWFMPRFDAATNQYTTEDLPCFERLRKAGFVAYVDHDASKLVGHYGEKEWKWDQWKRTEPKEKQNGHAEVNRVAEIVGV